MNRRVGLLLTGILLLASGPAFAEWRELFNGKDLSGWSKKGGPGTYAAEGGEIVGRSVPGGPNAFLCTEDRFGDFILEYEAKVDADLNSGVMIRALSQPDYRDGVVHGYQVEIDSSSRAWTGGIYDEQRRGWLNPVVRDVAASSAFKVNEWNTFRVEAVGSHIRTWVNGVPVANLIDDMTAEGFIGLQVHGVPDDPKHAGLEARFRNIRIMTDGVKDAVKPFNPEWQVFNYIPNTLSEGEEAQGWRLLWDGKSTKGWRSAKAPGFPKKGWHIKDGKLTVESSGGGEARNGGDIITEEEFSDFELVLDFHYAEGANSGIKYFVDPDLLKGEGSAIGLEFQILDDRRHPDAKMGVDGNRTIGSLYDLIPAENLSEPDRPAKRDNGSNVWNRARIIVRGGKVEHWLNEAKTVEYDRFSQMFKALVGKSKYRDWANFGRWETGPILLQDHGDLVSFRSIKIRKLSEN